MGLSFFDVMDIVGIIKIIHVMNVINIIHIGLRLLMTMANLVFFFGFPGGSPTTESPAPLARGSLSAPWASCSQASSRPQCLELKFWSPDPESKNPSPSKSANREHLAASQHAAALGPSFNVTLP